MKKIVIVGGGASGLAAAITAARKGCQVTVLEHKERPGKKILATGNGRCNLTNLRLDPDTGYRGGTPGFAASVLSKVTVEETLAFFEDMGLPVRDRDGYVYPRSAQAAAVADTLILEAEHLGARLLCGVHVRQVEQRKNGAFLVRAASPEGDVNIPADCVILATGSKAAPATGSDGSGYGLAEALGHTVIPPLPALVQLICRGKVFRQLAGIRAEGEVRLYLDGTLAAGDRGELQLTDYGISGIPVFQVSRYASVGLAEGRTVEAELDFWPDREESQVLSFLKRRRDRLPYRTGEEFLTGLFAKKLGCVLLSSSGISLTDPAGQIPDRKLERLAGQIKAFPAQITGTKSFDSAQICCGGVSVDQVDPATMESRLVPGLYLTGELLDIDGICGGYNLQWAWSTGILAGRSAAGRNHR